MVLLNLFYLLVLFQLSSALHCDEDALAKYRLAEVFKEITTTSIISDTPPSKTNLTWYLNLCNQKEEINQDCPKNSQICGIQTVLLPGEAPIKSQIISYGNGLNYKIHERQTIEGLLIKLDDNSWGSNSIFADINLICSAEDDIDVTWNLNALNVTWFTPAGCTTNSSIPPPKGDKPKDGDKEKEADDSWGWFTWLFIIFVLLIGGYIIIGAWITASKSPADFQDAVHDFVETLTNLAGSLPGFISEIFNKIFRSDNGGNRGGYSAV